jgi:hypothetical protein
MAVGDSRNRRCFINKDRLFLLNRSETKLGAQNQISLHLQDKNKMFLF